MKVYCVTDILYEDDRDFGGEIVSVFANKEDAIKFCIDQLGGYYSDLTKMADGEYVLYEPSELTVIKDYDNGKFRCESPHEEYLMAIEEHEVK